MTILCIFHEELIYEVVFFFSTIHTVVLTADVFQLFIKSSDGWVKIKLKLPHFYVPGTSMRYMCFDLTHAPVATAARAAATGLASMSTRPDPDGSGTVDYRKHGRTAYR